MFARVSDPGSTRRFSTSSPMRRGTRSACGTVSAPRAGANGRADPRRHEFSQTGSAFGRVARQYSGALGKIANCQVAVTAALWNEAQAWSGGPAVSVRRVADGRRRAARADPPDDPIPGEVAARVDVLRQVRAAGVRVTAVLAHANSATTRLTDYLIGPASLCARRSLTLRVFRGPPRLPAAADAAGGRPRIRPSWPPAPRPRRGRGRRRLAGAARGARYAGAIGGRREPGRPTLRRRASRPPMPGGDGAWTPRSGYSPNGIAAPPRGPSTTLVDLPATTSLRGLVRLAHQRWAIEQQYQELKGELGFDHFEGRTCQAGNSTSR